jgi:cytochrome c oxidase cbb3-type subunit 3
MSDFFSEGWSFYIGIITLLGIFACLLLLWCTARKKIKADAQGTTGHVWDNNLTELNNPLPLWWMGLFLIAVSFSLLYLFVYPGLGAFKGQFDWTSHQQYERQLAQANAREALVYAPFSSQSVEQLAGQPQAYHIGERLFMNNCAQCHGSDAHGGPGFPNLTDSDWLHGGTPEKIIETITHGRVGKMPVMAKVIGSAEEVKNVAHYVLSLSSSPHDSLRASLGKPLFVACAACHGSDGKGNQALGAPNLTDHIWLHGWGEEAVVRMITQGKVNAMPAQKDKLSAEQIRVLAAYVWGLSHTNGFALQPTSLPVRSKQAETH